MPEPRCAACCGIGDDAGAERDAFGHAALPYVDFPQRSSGTPRHYDQRLHTNGAPVAWIDRTARAAGKRAASIHNWEPLRDVSRPEQVAYSYYREPPLDHAYDDAVGAEAVRLLREEGASFDVVFLYFGSVDAAGHAFGWMSPEYLGQLQRVDGLLGRVLDAMPADATIVVQADHGGHERMHGTDMPEDMTIPWIAAGPAIRRNHRITAPVSLLDTAPTLARALGIAPHAAWEGRIIEEIFIEQ